MNFSPRFSCDDDLAQVLHDLRQPLGNIGFGAEYLSLVLEPESERVQDQVEMIRREVRRLDSMLDQTFLALRRHQIQRAASSENLELTNPQSAAVA